MIAVDKTVVYVVPRYPHGLAKQCNIALNYYGKSLGRAYSESRHF